MFKRIPSPATAIALVALFVALAGTSYAAFSLPKNSVGSKQLKNNAVTNGKIKNGAVGGSKLNLSGVTVPSAANATNAANASSLGGAASSSFLRRTVTEVADTTVNSGAGGGTFALCPSGYEAVGGGVDPENGLSEVVTVSEPMLADTSPPDEALSLATPGQHAYANGWRGFLVNNSGVTKTMAVAAICAQIGP